MSTTFHFTKTDNQQDYSIRQGATFSFAIKYKELDISDWEFRGQIRRKYADNDENVLADFDFSVPVFDIENNWTFVVANLSATTTETLPIHPKRRATKRDAVIVGINVWVYDIEAESPTGEVVRITEGFVEVNQEVTR